MNWMLFVLSAVIGFSGAVILILSVLMGSGFLLDAGLIALLIAALLLIGIVLAGDVGHRKKT